MSEQAAGDILGRAKGIKWCLSESFLLGSKKWRCPHQSWSLTYRKLFFYSIFVTSPGFVQSFRQCASNDVAMVQALPITAVSHGKGARRTKLLPNPQQTIQGSTPPEHYKTPLRPIDTQRSAKAGSVHRNLPRRVWHAEVPLEFNLISQSGNSLKV